MSPIEYITVLLGLLASIGAGMCLHLSVRLKEDEKWIARLQDEVAARVQQRDEADDILLLILNKWDYVGESAQSFSGPYARGFDVERNSIMRQISTAINKHFDHPKPEMPAHTANPLPETQATVDRMSSLGMPVGTDNPALLELGAEPLRFPSADGTTHSLPGQIEHISDEALLAEMDTPHTLPGALPEADKDFCCEAGTRAFPMPCPHHKRADGQ